MKYLWLGLFMLGWISVQAQLVTNKGVEIKNSALVSINGDWTNEAGTVILNNGTIRTTKSFVNFGTLDNNSTGKFILHYDTDLNFQPGGSALGTLTKEGIGTALLTGTIHIKDSLLLNKGKLQLMINTDTVFLRSGATLVSDTGAYVKGGLIARAGTGDLVFPLGKGGHYLPLKIYNVQAQRVTASVEDAPALHTAGPGVESLIDFPYAWRVTGVPGDTATYIELGYPNTLPSASDLIVVREVPGAQYASMGARTFENASLRITVKSYSRRLNGLFSVAQGFTGDITTDSLALVSLYQVTGGTNWSNNSHWLAGNMDTWHGITLTGQSITGVALPGNNLDGPVPGALADIISLVDIDLSGNKLTSLPDFSLHPQVQSLDVTDNHLTFASLEPNADVPGFSYLGQEAFGIAVDTTISAGTGYVFTASAGGTNDIYNWTHNGVAISGATSPSYNLPAITRATMGDYVAEVANPGLPGLILKSRTQRILAHANLSGQLFADAEVTAEQGELTLYKVRSGAFEPVARVAIANDGVYVFENVILDDYQLLGFADTTLYARALPTYYENTIFWEEADTLSLENDMTGLDIISRLKPAPLSGGGSIGGHLREGEASGRMKADKPVAQASVSAHRIETGSDLKEVLSMAAHDITDEQGAFLLSNLPAGEYRLNIQYPGYPMDESSFTRITLGSALESQVVVEANVSEGKIKVSKLIITGLDQAENYKADIYPNPAADFIQFKFDAEMKSRVIKVSDYSGKAVISIPAEDKEISVNVGNLQKGVYIVQVRENGMRVKTLKVSIE